MRVIYHNWSATKQRLHPQSVAEISCLQFCQGTGFDNVRHRLGLATRTQISVCKSSFPSAGTAVSLFRAKTVQQRQERHQRFSRDISDKRDQSNVLVSRECSTQYITPGRSFQYLAIMRKYTKKCRHMSQITNPDTN